MSKTVRITTKLIEVGVAEKVIPRMMSKPRTATRKTMDVLI